jgi:hypothetical protein
MTMTLGAAARFAGVSKTTLSRAIKAGRMSAAGRRDDSSYEIDPAELCRTFPPRSPEGDGSNGGAADATALLQAKHRAELAEHCWRAAENALADVTAQRGNALAQRNAWQQQAERLVLVAPTPGTTRPVT